MDNEINEVKMDKVAQQLRMQWSYKATEMNTRQLRNRTAVKSIENVVKRRKISVPKTSSQIKLELEQDALQNEEHMKHIRYVQSLGNKEYFEHVYGRLRGGPNRWITPLQDDVFQGVDPSTMPENFANVYKKMRWLRGKILAPVDLVGSASMAITVGEMCGIAKDEIKPINYRIQVLVSVMLSAQTKDETNAKAMLAMTHYCMHELEEPDGITLNALLKIDEANLNDLIRIVGFHKKKTKYIKQMAQMLQDRFDSDVPTTIDEMLSIPGVGPKMGFLGLQKMWGIVDGICVDVHVHRICNLWKWTDPRKCKTPEHTRKALEEWLPKPLWTEINSMLVGFGQVMGKSRGREFAMFTDMTETSEEEKMAFVKLHEDIRIHSTSYAKWISYLETLDITEAVPSADIKIKSEV